MKTANYFDYVAAIDNIKLQNGRLETNNFVLSDKFKDAMTSSDCWLLESPKCVFVAVLEHDAFYRLYYHAVNGDVIADGLRLINEQYDKKLPLICTVTGKEAYVEGLVPFFYREGYSLRKRIRRYNSFNSRRILRPEEVTAEFACKEDAEEIQELLLSHFDLYSEALPTFSEIINNIEKEQIVIARRDSKIAALTYFELHGSIIHGIFDVTRAEYRKSLVFIELGEYIKQVMAERGIELNRGYGWRDMDNKRLIRASAILKHVPQDFVLYTVINPFGKDV